jgi:hypothetical protein
MKKFFLVILCNLALYIQIQAQNVENNRHQWFNLIDYHQIYSFSYSFPNYTWTGSDMYSAKSLRFITGCYVDPRLSIGAGISIDNYQVASSTATFPLLVDVRGYLKNSTTSPFAYCTGSYSFESGAFAKSYGIEIGAGYKIRLGRKLSLNIAVSYNFKQYPHMEVLNINYNTAESSISFQPEKVHSLSIGLGLSF